MKYAGETIEGTMVVSGMFAWYGTHGIPLENILYWCKNNNKVVDWVDYIESALADGYKLSNLKSRILTAVGEIYGIDYCKEFRKKLDEW